VALTDPSTDAAATAPEAPEGARRFAGDAAWVLAAQAAGKAASFAFVVVVTRSVGVLDYGYFNFAASLVPLFLVFSMWGLDINVYRAMIASGADRAEVVSSGLAVRASLGGGALLLALGVGPLFLDGGRAVAVLALVGGALLLDEISAFFGACMRAMELTRMFALIILVNRLLSLALVVPVVILGGGVVAVSATYLLGSASTVLYAALHIRRAIPHLGARSAARRRIGTFFREGAPLGIAAGLNMALFRIDAVLLQALEGPRAVARYGIAYRFFESFLFVAWSVAVVAMSRLDERSPGAAGRAFNTTAALLLAFYLPIAAGAHLAGPEIIRVVCGERDVSAAPAVLWLTAAGALYAVAHLSRVASMLAGERHRIALVAGLALAVNVAVNLVVIPRYGVTGAAAATFATEVLEVLLLLLVYRRATSNLRPHRVVLVPVVAVGAMLLAAAASGTDGLAALAVGTVAFVAALPVAARLLAPDESRLALAALRVGR
jgi:O-antigen/teichoic acid export membrane protein